MKRWQAILHIHSPLATPLSAQRLFGHVCWSIAWRDGAEAVADFLRAMRTDNPPLVLGEPVPLGFAPMPAHLRDGRATPALRGKRRLIWGLYQRCGLLPRPALLRAAEDLAGPRLIEALEATGWPRPTRPQRQVRIRSTTSRTTGGPDGRGEWLAVEVWPDDPAGRIEVPIASDLPEPELRRLLEDGLACGFGRGATAGFGQVELVGLEAIDDWPTVADANALVTLGSCVPRRDDPAGGCWRIAVHWGRLGGGYATGGGTVQKRPVLTLRAGAVLTAVASGQWPVARNDESADVGRAVPALREAEAASQAAHDAGTLPARDFVGRLVENVHPERPEVVHYGLAPVVAVRTAVASGE